MKNTISNNFISVTVTTLGAEICSLISNKTKKEYIWQADPKIWPRSSPVLFPIVGFLRNNQYIYEGKTYALSRHGFTKDVDHEMVEYTTYKIKFRLAADESTLEVYPFRFELYTTYTLFDRMLDVGFEVVNRDEKTMYFSIGAHPGFNCPINDGNQYIEFDNVENIEYIGKDPESGLMGHSRFNLIENDKRLRLNYNMFNSSALFFERGDIKSIAIANDECGKVIRLTFDGFTYLGLWTIPGAPFICIEPCYGVSDFVDSNGKITNKVGIEKLEPGKNFKCSYQIEVEENVI